MPNWCDTTIRISNDSRIRLRQFNKILTEWTSKNYSDNGFGLKWLGNIVGHSGIETEYETKFACRGTLIDSYLSENELVIVTDTAWSPCIEMWIALIKKYLPEAYMLYYAIEPGCGILATNDPKYERMWRVDYDGYGSIESNDCIEQDDLVKMLQEELNTGIDDINALIEMIVNSDDDRHEYISINQWDIVDADCWD